MAFPQATSHEVLVSLLADRLHDLCQPLTALQCRLEIAEMQQAAGDAPLSPEWHRECLKECRRMNLLMTSMRESLQQAQSLEKARTR